MKTAVFNTICILIGIVLLSGCASTVQRSAPETFAKDIHGAEYPALEPRIASEGSLWTETGSEMLFVDMRAREVGDLVTVRISESPTGSLSAKTETERDSSIGAGIPNLLGISERYGANHSLDEKSLFKANFDASFTGEGTNERNGSLDAYITARVVQVLPNRNLRILGKQEIKVNNETQYIALSGIVRPEDIDTNNEVQSCYIADARIDYSGKGVIADKQRPGWLMRVVDTVWPF